MIDLWAPHAGLSLEAALVTAFLLGIVHGITPDEHTWPITFSYAVGSYSTRKGLLAGLIFSLAFTVQRALASELAYLALDRWFTASAALNYVVYIVVGAVMWLAGRHMLGGHIWHLWTPHGAGRGDGCVLRAPRLWMPAVHGLIAGFGFGAFALILYTVLSPAMPGAAWGWAPGALFGLGTTVVQAAVGALFGWFTLRLRLPAAAVREVALTTAGRTLGWGGLVFIAGGLFGLLAPDWAGFEVSTGLRVHNLAHLNLGFLLVMVVVLLIGVITLLQQVRHWRLRADISR